MRKTIFFIFFLYPGILFLHSFAFSQGYTVDMTITARVDTTNKDIKDIFELYKNYLLSRPDSVYDNSFWNESEKIKYGDFDLTRSSFFLNGFLNYSILARFKPVVLAIEPENGKYSIRTLFYAEDLQGKSKQSNPWCITKIFAVKENETWKLENALPNIIKNWNVEKKEHITFYYPDTHKYSNELASKSDNFCDSIIRYYRFPQPENINFYICRSADEVGELMGFEYFFTGYTAGKTIKENNIIFSGLNSEWYPHELVHMIVPENKLRHKIIDEGFATFIGGSGTETFEDSFNTLSQFINENDTISFDDILTWKVDSQAAFYTGGAVLCKLVEEYKGVDGINELLLSDTSSDDILYDVVMHILKMDKISFSDAWKQAIIKTPLK
jgi:hypothetical protein